MNYIIAILSLKYNKKDTIYIIVIYKGDNFLSDLDYKCVKPCIY